MPSARLLHENNSQGVLYEFIEGARRWKERQKRLTCVGGEHNGQRLTPWEMSQSKWAPFYHRFNSQDKTTSLTQIWLFLKERN